MSKIINVWVWLWNTSRIETLDGPDCKALKAILAAEKKWDQKKVDAENFYNKGLGESKQMEAKVKECEEEGNLLD